MIELIIKVSIKLLLLITYHPWNCLIQVDPVVVTLRYLPKDQLQLVKQPFVIIISCLPIVNPDEDILSSHLGFWNKCCLLLLVLRISEVVPLLPFSFVGLANEGRCSKQRNL